MMGKKPQFNIPRINVLSYDVEEYEKKRKKLIFMMRVPIHPIKPTQQTISWMKSINFSILLLYVGIKREDLLL